jgi:Tfp pilus assembly ATPase PilU
MKVNGKIMPVTKGSLTPDQAKQIVYQHHERGRRQRVRRRAMSAISR